MFYQEYIFLFHLLLVGPALMILGYYHDHPKIKDNQALWNIVLLTGLGTCLYHALRWFQFRQILSKV